MLNLLDIAIGTKLALHHGIVAEVIENMRDGEWLMVRLLVVPDAPGQIGTQELCHFQDIVKVLSKADGYGVPSDVPQNGDQ